MTSRWVSALCCARPENSAEASATCLARVSSSERARSSIRGATSISASNASRARIPTSFLSLALLRLKLTRDILSPDPTCKVERRVQEAFPELGKIRTNPVILRPTDDMAPEKTSTITPSLPNALASVEYDIFRASNEARRDRASVTVIAVSTPFEPEAIAPVIEAGQRVFGE